MVAALVGEGGEGGVGHLAVGAEIPGALALADALEGGGKHPDRHRLLAAVLGLDRGDREVIVGLEVGEADAAVDDEAEIGGQGDRDHVAGDGAHGGDVAGDGGDFAAHMVRGGGEAGARAEQGGGEEAAGRGAIGAWCPFRFAALGGADRRPDHAGRGQVAAS